MRTSNAADKSREHHRAATIVLKHATPLGLKQISGSRQQLTMRAAIMKACKISGTGQHRAVMQAQSSRKSFRTRASHNKTKHASGTSSGKVLVPSQPCRETCCNNKSTRAH